MQRALELWEEQVCRAGSSRRRGTATRWSGWTEEEAEEAELRRPGPLLRDRRPSSPSAASRPTRIPGRKGVSTIPGLSPGSRPGISGSVSTTTTVWRQHWARNDRPHRHIARNLAPILGLSPRAYGKCRCSIRSSELATTTEGDLGCDQAIFASCSYCSPWPGPPLPRSPSRARGAGLRHLAAFRL